MDKYRMANVVEAQIRNTSKNPMRIWHSPLPVSDLGDNGEYGEAHDIPYVVCKPSLKAKKQVARLFNSYLAESMLFDELAFYDDGEYWFPCETLRERDLMDVAQDMGIATSNERYELDYWKFVEEESLAWDAETDDDLLDDE